MKNIYCFRNLTEVFSMEQLKFIFDNFDDKVRQKINVNNNELKTDLTEFIREKSDDRQLMFDFMKN